MCCLFFGTPKFPARRKRKRFPLNRIKKENKLINRLQIAQEEARMNRSALRSASLAPRGGLQHVSSTLSIPARAVTARDARRGLATEDQGQPLSGGMFDHLQEIEVVGTSLSKSGGIVEVTARGGGTLLLLPCLSRLPSLNLRTLCHRHGGGASADRSHPGRRCCPTGQAAHSGRP
jgi:hypothetical protein